MGEKLKNFTLKHLPGGRVENLTRPYHFIRMLGPSRVGFAEVAVHRSDTDSIRMHPETESDTEHSPKPDKKSSASEQGTHRNHHPDWNSSKIDHVAGTAKDVASPLQDDVQGEMVEHPVSLPGAVHSPVHTKGSKYLVTGPQVQDDLASTQADAHSSDEAGRCGTEGAECGESSDAAVDRVTTTKRSGLPGKPSLVVDFSFFIGSSLVCV